MDVTTDNRDQYTFVIYADSWFQYLVRMTLFDKDNKNVLEGSEYPMEKKLPQGLYTIRLDSNGSIEDTIILLNADCRYRISHSKDPQSEAMVLMPPPTDSAVPLDEKVFTSSLEYYQQPAIELASLNTWPIQRAFAGSSFYLFVRFYSRDRYVELKENNEASPMTTFRLLDHKGEVICDLSKGLVTIVNNRDGWLAFNCMMSPGLYLLEYTGEDNRQVPVYLLENFHTQCFLLLDKRPVFSSMRIFLQKERRFDPYDPRNIYTDLLFTRLQNKDFTIEEGLARSIRSGELEAFMLHLLYAYISVLSNKAAVEDLCKVVMRPVREEHRWLSGPLPDWRAILILGSSSQSLDDNPRPVRGVPMVHPGYLAIKEAAVEHKELIREKSLNDLITIHALYDSLITTFTPVTIRGDEFLRIEANRWKAKELREDVSPMDKYSGVGHIDYYADLLENRLWKDFLDGYQADTADWLEFLIHELVSKEHIRSLETLSQRLRISVVTIKRTIEAVRDRLLNKPWGGHKATVQVPDPAPTLEDQKADQLITDWYHDR